MNQVETSAISTAALSQIERVSCAFTAPARTFEDIRNGHRSWWLPFIILSIASYLLLGAVIERVGIQQTIQNQIRLSPRAQEQLAQMTPEQVEKAQNAWAISAEASFAAAPLLSLLYAVMIAAVLLGTINFGFGGNASFGEVLAATYYAWLPTVIQVLMGIAVMWFQPPEIFNIKNFAPTNAAALFLDPASSSQALYTFLSQIDVVTIWTLVLLSIGISTVARVKRSQGYIAVFGWWIIIVLFKVGVAAAFG